jgi:hypothetical protein
MAGGEGDVPMHIGIAPTAGLISGDGAGGR